MLMIMSGSPKEPKKEQLDAGHSQSKLSDPGDCARVSRNGLHQQARRERPCGCRAADERDELAALHSITSSARANAGSRNEVSSRRKGRSFSPAPRSPHSRSYVTELLRPLTSVHLGRVDVAI